MRKTTAVGKTEEVVDVWEKACDCEAESVAGDITLKVNHCRGRSLFMATYSPGPRCSGCGKEWRRL